MFQVKCNKCGTDHEFEGVDSNIRCSKPGCGSREFKFKFAREDYE